MLNKDEEIGLLEILKVNFPKLDGKGLVLSINEFLSPTLDLQKYICNNQTTKQAALPYITEKIPYIVLDESEGYKCIFFRGRHVQAQYDVTHSIVVRFVEETNV